MIQKEDYYESLDLPTTATEKQVKKHYFILSTKWHPQKNSVGKKRAEKVFTEISEAYEVLSNQRLRSVYNEQGFEGVIKFSNSRFDFSNFSLFDAEKVFERFNRGRDPVASIEENDPFFDDKFFDVDDEFFDQKVSPSKFFESSINTKKTIIKSPRSHGTEKSVKTVIVDKDGRRVKKTVTTITNPDGSQQVIEEESEEPSNSKFLRD